MTKILVTGSAGFVGAHFVEHIIKNTDWDVVGLDSFRHRGDSRRVDHLPHSRYQIYTHDLTTPISRVTKNLIGKVDFIVNFASLSHVDSSIEDPVPFVQNNVSLILNILEFAREVSPDKFIQVSTDEVFGPALDDYRHKEWDQIIPSNPYAASKAAQEAIAISYWRTYNVPLIITNTMNMIGERQDKEKFLPLLISKIVKGETIQIHGREGMIGKRFYLHARNQADAILHLLKTKVPTLYTDDQTKVQVPDRFNVVGDVELDNLELAKMVASIIGKPLSYELVDFHAARPGHDRRYALDGEKIKALGWKAPLDFEESLRKTIHWTLKNPAWFL